MPLKTIWMAVVVVINATMLASAAALKFDTAKIEQITGLKGTWNPAENVFKITAPRTDVKVTVSQWPLPPFLGLTSWAAFQPGRKKPAMVMGDLVLFQDEVNPVMSVAFANGLEVTALHNHFFYDEPKIYFMHIAGEGRVEPLAEAVRRALDRVKEIRAAQPLPSTGFGGTALPTTNAITAKAIEDILGVRGQSKDGMFKVILGRKTQMPCGCEAAQDMGVNTWAAFAGTDDRAVIDGDFAVQEDELAMVLRALRHYDMNIVAIHHHMSGEKPKMLFVHFWGTGRSANLAMAIKTALQAQGR
jgi:uncharacterized protein DUF1259